MDAGVTAAIVTGAFALAGTITTALLGRAAAVRARRAEERVERLQLLTTLLDEQREELDRRRSRIRELEEECDSLRRRLEEAHNKQ